MSFVVDIDGCTLFHYATNQSGDVLNYTAGLRWSPPKQRGLIPFAEVLAGGTKVTHQFVDVAKRQQLIQQASLTHSDVPENAAWTTSEDVNGVTLVVNSGLSYQTTSGVRFQLATLGYQQSWLNQLEGLNYNHDLRFSFGVAFQLGAWQR